MKVILLMTLCAPIFLQAQLAKINTDKIDNPVTCTIQPESSGIIWVDNLNWQQVRKKAKKEKKYIFVDCFTTWCGPCKKMDKDVYANDSVGDLLNAKFISVKLQMDSSKTDNAFIQSRYKTAKEIGSTYRVAAYPTFLFFSPNGEIVSKDFGYKMPATFMQAAQDALNPSRQYYVLLRGYKKGKKDFVNMPYLISMSKQMGDTVDYYPILTDYYAYLLSLDKNKLYTKENIEFIASTLESSTESAFTLFYPEGKAVNNAMGKEGYAKNVVDRIILKEKVSPFLKAAEGKPEPDWNILYSTIAKDYKGDYADRNILEAKMKWYLPNENMLKYAITLNDKMEKYGSDTTSMTEDFKLNNKAFIIWEKIKDSQELKRMIRWMTGVVRRGEKATGVYTQYWPLYIDTYANLLYKVGEISEAIKWQELAVTKSREFGTDKSDANAIQENLEKMKKGQPTWPEDTK
jgi:thioredoxin-related protein